MGVVKDLTCSRRVWLCCQLVKSVCWLNEEVKSNVVIRSFSGVYNYAIIQFLVSVIKTKYITV